MNQAEVIQELTAHVRDLTEAVKALVAPHDAPAFVGAVLQIGITGGLMVGLPGGHWYSLQADPPIFDLTHLQEEAG